MTFVASTDAHIRQATRWLATAGLLALFANSLAVVVDIALRALLSRPIERLGEVSSVVFCISAACCLPAATAARQHITIRALDRFLAPRGRAGLNAVAALVTAAIFGIVAWQVSRYAGELAQTGRTLSQMRVPLAPFWYFVSACMVLNFIIQCWVASHQALVAVGQQPVDLGETREETIL